MPVDLQARLIETILGIDDHHGSHSGTDIDSEGRVGFLCFRQCIIKLDLFRDVFALDKINTDASSDTHLTEVVLAPYEELTITHYRCGIVIGSADFSECQTFILLALVDEVIVDLGSQGVTVGAITKHAIQPDAPIVHVTIVTDCHTVVVTSSDLFHLQTIVFEESDFLRGKRRLDVTVAQRAYLLSIHPVKEALLAAIAPCVHAAIICQGQCVILAHSYINDFVLFQPLNMFRLFEVDAILIAVAKHAPVTLTKRV